MTRFPILAPTVVALLLGVAACRSPERPPELAIESHSSRRAESGALMERVDWRKGPPDWLDKPRVEDRYFYSIGIVEGQRSPEHDLHRAMIEARTSMQDWFAENGGRIASRRGLVPTLEVELKGMRFDELAYDEREDIWYALAKLDREAEAALAKAQWTHLNEQHARDLTIVEAGDAAFEERVESALDILFDLERRRQYAELYELLAEEELVEPADLGSVELEDAARDLLLQHSVRVVLDTPPITGLRERVDGVFGAVYLSTHEFGDGLMTVRLAERELFSSSPTTPYLYLEGEVQTALAGGAAPVRTVPIRIVQTAASLDEARARAGREAKDQVAAIVWDALRRDAL